MRKDSVEMPSASELQDILSREAKRAIPEGKETIHYPDFTTFDVLCAAYNIDPEMLHATELVFDEEAFRKGEVELTSIAERIVSGKPTPEQLEALHAAYDYLSEEDEIQQSDVIFVFGSKQKFRIDKAIELYRDGIAPLIVVSGKSAYYESTPQTEADAHQQYAAEQGVPLEHILVETDSITLPDNVKSSLNLLDQKGIVYSRITLVNSAYAQRRGWAHFKKFTPDSVEFTRINAKGTGRLERDTWHRELDTAKTVLNEFGKMKVSVLLNTA